MTNDEAREVAFLRVQALDLAAGAEPPSPAHWKECWNACLAHLRATGQLCTAEERAVLKAAEHWRQLNTTVNEARLAHYVDAMLARRAKGVSDGG